MKNKLSSFLAIIMMVAVFTEHANAQLTIPPASSPQTISQGLGISTVTLTYSRPNMNGRKIFGELVPYDQVWRTGANNIPIIVFEREVSIAGNKVNPGTYGILTIPNNDKWTVIFTKNSEQWGSYTYTENEDLFRFTVTPTKLSSPVETFTINFSDVSPTHAKLNISWENTLLGFDLMVNEDADIMASIDNAMKGDKKPYFQAAQYYYQNNKDIEKALEWINEAEKTDPKAPYFKYWKALIQLKAGDKQGASASAQAGIELAKATNNEEYVKLNSQVLKKSQE